MSNKNSNPTYEAIERTAKMFGIELPEEDLESIAQHIIRKFAVIGKDEDYIPFLVYSETYDFLFRKAVNFFGQMRG